MSARQIRFHRARQRGMTDGIASLFRPQGRGRPAPPMVHRSFGSLGSDMRELKRDSDRLFSARG